MTNAASRMVIGAQHSRNDANDDDTTPNSRSGNNDHHRSSFSISTHSCSVPGTSTTPAGRVALLARITPPSHGPKFGTDLIVCIDTSTSMASHVEMTSLETAGGYLQILDVVKHAARTLVECLGDGDRFGVVSFSSDARLVLPLTSMNTRGHAAALRAIDQLRPDRQTNIWDGMTESIAAMGAPQVGRSRAIFVLTDGVPTKSPARGNVREFEHWKQTHYPSGGLPAHVHFFGFGYDLHSNELSALATIGGGSYSFIPDEGMVGTVFTNALANVAGSCCSDIALDVTAPRGVLAGLGASVVASKSSTELATVRLRLGAAQFGQTKDWVLEGAAETMQQITFRATILGNGDSVIQSNVAPTRPTEPYSTEALAEWLRVQAVVLLQRLTSSFTFQAARRTWDSEATHVLLMQLLTSIHPRSRALSEDLHGEVALALSSEGLFNRWGLHYLRSLAKAHTRQECNNFKDAGVQVYGGEYVKTLSDFASDAFNNIEPPQLRVSPVVAYATPSPWSVARAVAPVMAPMATINCASGPCFAPGCLVTMHDGTTKPIQDLRKGDTIRMPSNPPRRVAVVRCLIKTVCASGFADLVQLGGGGVGVGTALITPYHPVLVNSVWTFPCQLGEVKHMECDAVYNLVLESGHIAEINGTKCVTLGHGFTDNDVIQHEYFGTDAVVQDFEKHPDWESGLIVISQYKAERDPESGMVRKVDVVGGGVCAAASLSSHDDKRGGHPSSTPSLRCRT